ncbi:MAG: hypothetical protein ABI883_03665 [Chthoniobacterales bacterium]
MADAVSVLLGENFDGFVLEGEPAVVLEQPPVPRRTDSNCQSRNGTDRNGVFTKLGVLQGQLKSRRKALASQ